MNYLPILLLFIGGCILTIGDRIMKKWVISSKTYLYIIGLGIYLIGMIFLAESFKYKNIAVASTIFVIFNILTLCIVSWIFFHETINIYQIAGIIIGICAIILFEISY